jgi:hypothetical protein
VFQAEGSDFRANIETDLSFLRLSMQNLADYKDRIGINVAVDPTKLKSGAIKGSITVFTNDPEFPRLSSQSPGRCKETGSGEEHRQQRTAHIR